MKTTSFLTILFFLILFSFKTFAQGEAAVPFLLLNPSPSLSAMGQTGTALPTEDPSGFIWNPAQLGYNSLNNNLSFIFYPSKINLPSRINYGFELKGLAFNAGYNFKELIGFPLSFGFGYGNTKFYYLTPLYVRNIRPADDYNAYSFAVGIDYFVQLSIGYSIKNVSSTIIPDLGEPITLTSETTVKDFGILLKVPVVRLIDDNLLLPLNEGLSGKPTFDFSLGYSKSNIGDEISYIDWAQADPLPRIDRLGYGINAGFDLVSDNFKINALNISFTVEADDILIKRDPYSSNWSYQSTLSDLKFWKNIVQIEGDENILSHAATKLEFVESFSYYFGHFFGRGYPDARETNGYEIRAKGLFKLWALWANDPITDFLCDHFDIRYYNTNYFTNTWNETKMTGLAFYFHNLNELFE